MAARPPRPKNRGIRRARDDARTGAPPRAARPGRYRAGERKRAVSTHWSMVGNVSARYPLRIADAVEVSGVYKHRHPYVRARRRRKHLGLQFIESGGLSLLIRSGAP